MTEKKIVDNHRQKYAEITKDCLWNESQNYFVRINRKKKLVCLQIDCKHLQCICIYTYLKLALNLL